VALDPLIVNRDDIAQSTRCIVGHGGFLLLTWLRLATSSPARFGGRQPYSIVRNIPYVIPYSIVRNIPYVIRTQRQCCIAALEVAGQLGSPFGRHLEPENVRSPERGNLQMLVRQAEA
jgi:hypothetical protein